MDTRTVKLGDEVAQSRADFAFALDRSTTMRELSQREQIEFKGTIIRIDSDGFGIVKLDDPAQYGTFTKTELISNGAPMIARIGRRVRGVAIKSGNALRILELIKE